jgi:hypothetical protein
MKTLLIFALLLGAAVQAQNYCKSCHSEQEVEFRDSVHREELDCVSCHGGDASTPELPQAHGKGFRGKITRAQIPAFCAECHADQKQMRPYGLSTDQYALYLTSGHGRKFAQGDAQVAICTDCHQSHRVLLRDDPQSPTHPQKIAATCGSCHADAERMRPYGLSAWVVAEYEASVHALAKRQGSAARLPSCADCHGSHGAAPPGVGEVSKVCMHCHRQTREFFHQSPHFKTLAAAGYGECAACHGEHRILKPGPQLWASSCAACHESGSRAAAVGAQILALFAQAQADIDQAGATIEQARQVPLAVEDYEQRLAIATTYLMEAGPLSHTLDVAAIEELTRKSRSVAQELQAEIHEKMEVFAGRRLVVGAVWLYLLITILALQYFKRGSR